MITIPYEGTASFEIKLPIEQIIKEKGVFEGIMPIESLRTSYKPQPFFLIFNLLQTEYRIIDWINYPETTLQIIPDENYEKLLKFESSEFEKINLQETILTYPILELESLEQLYTFRRRSEVIKFLIDNSFIFPILYEANEKIKEYFGKSMQIILEVITDIEVTSDKELVIFIRTNLPVKEAVKQLEQFDNEWWLDAPTTARRKLCIDVEFK